MSTLAEFRQRVRDQGGFATDDTSITDARINTAVNKALRHISLEHNWPWLDATSTVTTVSDQGGYNLPSDFLRSVSVRYAGAEALNLRSVEEVDAWQTSGRAGVYGFKGGQLLLGGPPASELEITHRYIRSERVLSSDSDTPLIPDVWDEGVVEYALYCLFRRVRDTDNAELAKIAYGEWLMEARDNIQQSVGSPRIRVRPGSWV